jgi:trans-aconitate 2-methyltransferase
MPQWDAGVYLKFAGERTQPSLDLIHRIQLPDPRRIADLGCGPGNSTEALRRQWPAATVVGLDNSSEMIEAARSAYPDGAWIVGDASSWKADPPFDLVFSNAMVQWVPDHETLCRHLLNQVAPGGALAVQAPAHYNSALHVEIVEASLDPQWGDRLESARNALTKEPPEFYYDLFAPIASRLDLWETVYYHIVDGPEAVIEWFRGTGLRPFLQALGDDEQRRHFERALLARYEKTYARRASGKSLFPFRRLFFVAYR